VAISPQLPEHSLRLRSEKDVPFELLHDPENRLAREFGVRIELSDDLKAANRSLGLDLPAFNGDDTWSLPIPSRFIIDQKKRVRYAVLDPDYTLRTTASHTLSALWDMI
jgi:peroxiredoxin